MTLKSYSLKQPEAAPGISLLGMSDAALLSLRHEIDVKLKIEIKNLNLTEELGLQYAQGKQLLSDVQADDDTPANQKAQVFNSVGAMLDKIIKQQKIVYSAERIKRFEVAFLKVLDKLPPESKEVYFDLYGEFLDDKGA